MRPFSEWSTMNLSAGRKSEHIVGIPTPRFTSQPSWNSAASRAAIRSRVRRFLSMLCLLLLRRLHRLTGNVEDAVGRNLHQSAYVDTGGMHLIRVDAADG